MDIDLAAFWQYSNAFFNSTFFTAISASCAGAFAGAVAAQRIVERGKERAEILVEMNNTSAATVTALSLCNTFLAIKKVHVKPLRTLFDRQKSDYSIRVQRQPFGQLTSDTPPLVFDLQMLVLLPLQLPLDTLHHLVFEKLSLDDRRALMLLNALSGTIHTLNISVENRNRLIASYQAARMSVDDLIPLYFGLPDRSEHVVNQEYPALIEAIYRQTDEGIFFSKSLCEDLYDHNRTLAVKFKKLFGKGAPGTMDKPDFTTPEREGLIPLDAEFPDWLTLFRKEKSPAPRRKSIYSVFLTAMRRIRSRISGILTSPAKSS